MNLMQHALDDANEIHSHHSDVWVTISHMHGQTKLKWGYVTNGQRESVIQTITYHLEKDGTVGRSKYTHV